MPNLTFNRQDLDLWVGADVLERGLRYQPLVGELRRIDTEHGCELGARVQGSARRPYETVVDWDGETFEGRCSCPYAIDCKHAVAVALVALKQWGGPLPAMPPAWAPPPIAAAPAPTLDWQTALERFIQAPAPAASWPAEPLAFRLKLAASDKPGDPQRLLLAPGRRGPGDRFKPMPFFWLNDSRGVLPGDRLLAKALEALVVPGSVGGFYTLKPDTLHEALELLATARDVADASGLALALRPDQPLTSRLSYEREGEAAVLRPTLFGPDGASSAAEAPVLLGTPPHSWAWLSNALHPVSLPAGLGSQAVTIPAADRPEFERRYLPDLAVGGRLVGPEIPAVPKVKKGKPVGQLVLEEREGRLHARLGFLYGGVRVEADEPLVHVGPPSGPWYTRAPRIERRLLDKLPQPTYQMPSRRNAWTWYPPKPSATLDFSGDAALDFLFDELPKLVEAGIEVLGEDRLSALRLNRHSASTSFKVRSGIDWLGVEGTLTVGDDEIPWPALWEALANSRRYVRLGAGGYARLPADWLKAQRPLFEALGLDSSRLGLQGGVRLSRYQAPLLDALLAKADHTKTDKAWKNFSHQLRTFGGIEDAPLPAGFAGSLRAYQQAGLNYLVFLRDYGLHGILADDMGLGKTVQAAALLLANHQGVPKAAPSLVIAPTSVIFNWQLELARFAPALRTLVLHGPTRDFAAIAQADVVITTYATARLDLAVHQQRRYHTLILDEAQAIKNPRSQTAQAMRALEASHRLCLTGTPIENNLMELWSQFAFLMPGLLGKDTEFKSRYAGPIALGDRAAVSELKTRTGPFILRRLKSEVATDLPARNDFVVWCELAPAQRKLYDTILAASRAHVMAAVAEKGGVARNQITILAALLKLRQVCCHPALLGLPETQHLPSAKVDAFLELVDELVAGGHRALVFSQFTTMLGHLREKLEARGIAYEYLDGQTQNRQARVARFNQGNAPLFLISLKAGGTGLNLVGADYVIHYDPWWNPAVEEQATDRAHRIGQTRQVFNYKLLAKNTVEEKLLALQEQKRALVRDVLDADALGKHLNLDDLKFLFGEGEPVRP